MSVLVAALALLQQQSTSPAESLLQNGREAIEMIRKNYYIPDSKLYAQAATTQGATSQVSFNWGVGVMLSALNSAAEADPKYLPWLTEYADATRVYWNDKGPVAGYDVLPGPKDVDRYYDDNDWMVLALVDTYKITGDKKYLTWAEGTLDFVLSGEDTEHGGGIFWHENDKKSRNTCSTGPAAAACMAIYRQTKSQKLLTSAIRLYTWTKKTLQDPADHLFFDSIGNDGKIGRAKFSYNTALMIRSAAELYSVTKNPQYKKDLIQMQTASSKKWLVEGTIHDEGRFAHLLLDAWLSQRKLVPVQNPAQATSDMKSIYTPLAWIHVFDRTAEGFYGGKWYQPPTAEQKKYELIDQASAARAYFAAANYFNRRK